VYREFRRDRLTHLHLGVQAWVTPLGWQASVSECTAADFSAPRACGWLFQPSCLVGKDGIDEC